MPEIKGPTCRLTEAEQDAFERWKLRQACRQRNLGVSAIFIIVCLTFMLLRPKIYRTHPAANLIAGYAIMLVFLLMGIYLILDAKKFQKYTIKACWRGIVLEKRRYHMVNSARRYRDSSTRYYLIRFQDVEAEACSDFSVYRHIQIGDEVLVFTVDGNTLIVLG